MRCQPRRQNLWNTPFVMGLNLTLIVQLAPGLTVVQVFVWLNEPVTAILLTIRTPRPVLVSFTDLALLVVNTTWVEKVRLVGENVTAGNTPTAVNGSVCGLPGTLSVMLTAAVLVPVAEGVKVTVMSQLPPAGTDVPQLFVSAKFPLFVPVTLMDVIVSLPLPVLVKVETCGGLVMPTVWLPKFRFGDVCV